LLPLLSLSLLCRFPGVVLHWNDEGGLAWCPGLLRPAGGVLPCCWLWAWAAVAVNRSFQFLDCQGSGRIVVTASTQGNVHHDAGWPPSWLRGSDFRSELCHVCVLGLRFRACILQRQLCHSTHSLPMHVSGVVEAGWIAVRLAQAASPAPGRACSWPALHTPVWQRYSAVICWAAVT
jgi:hypothetical protein